jgi:hypothetical protein
MIIHFKDITLKTYVLYHVFLISNIKWDLSLILTDTDSVAVSDILSPSLPHLLKSSVCLLVFVNKRLGPIISHYLPYLPYLLLCTYVHLLR